MKLHGGEVLVGPLYAALPESPIDANLALRGAANEAWSLQRFAWKDPGVLELEATGTLDLTAESPLATLDASAKLPALATATPRYFESLLGTFGLKQVALDGAAEVSVQRTNGEWQRVEVELQPSTLSESRFGIEGLTGSFAWSAAAPLESSLRWQSARFYDVQLGAAALPLRSEQSGVALLQPATLDLLGGQLAIPRFAWRPGMLDAGFALRGLDLRQTSRALGWPEFTGTLSGELPVLRYADDVLSFDGGLRFDVFDGRIELADLTLERPLGVAPHAHRPHRARRSRSEAAHRRLRLRRDHRPGSTAASTACAWSIGSRSPSMPTCTPTRRRRTRDASASAPCRTCPRSAARA